MQNNFFQSGMRIGKAVKFFANFIVEIRRHMMAIAGKSKTKRNIANILFLVMFVALIVSMSFILYVAIGVVGPILIILAVIAISKSHNTSSNGTDNEYEFGDGYRDGPEGYGYYAGGYKVDD